MHTTQQLALQNTANCMDHMYTSLLTLLLVFSLKVSLVAGLRSYSALPRTYPADVKTNNVKLNLYVDPDFSVIGDGFLLAAGSVDISSVLQKATKRALDGGTAGASAAAIQVISLMWLRTTLNYQYRYGTSTAEALKTLYADGGILRFYQGLQFALVQGPLSRFGDTAANALMASVVESVDPTGAIFPLYVRTALGSVAAGVWRIVLMPVDTAKTRLQVNGKEGLQALVKDVSNAGPAVLYYGALASSAATVVGHFPWFYTYNFLSSHLPAPDQFIMQLQALSDAAAGNAGGSADAVAAAAAASTSMILSHFEGALADALRSVDPRILSVLRSAFIGLCASSCSDVASNWLRVLKTSKQTSALTSASNNAAGLNVNSSPLDLGGSSNSNSNSNSNSSSNSNSNGGMKASSVKTSAHSALAESIDGISESSDGSTDVSYVQLAKEIIAQDGVASLFGRGLKTRLLANAIQGMLFSVLLKYFEQSKH